MGLKNIAMILLFFYVFAQRFVIELAMVISSIGVVGKEVVKKRRGDDSQ